MLIGSKLKSALESFAQAEAQIVLRGVPVTAAESLELVQLRRQLITEFATLSAAIEAEPNLIRSPAMLTDATRLLAAFRTANSVNQAEWPVVRVREDAAGYHIAVQRVVIASDAFWSWAAQTLNFDRRHLIDDVNRTTSFEQR